MNREWELSAACRDEDPDVWFSGKTRAKALETCGSCSVRDACEVAALEREGGMAKAQRRGIVAGLTGAQRYELARRQKQAGAG